MAKFRHEENTLHITVDTSALSAHQTRLMKSLISLAKQVATTETEGEFFDGSAELMRMCASVIKTANFTSGLKVDGIPYADQALEYSMDAMFDCMESQKVVNYDN